VILAYEKPQNHNGEGVNVLYMDGHVEWLMMAAFQQEMQRQPGLVNPNNGPRRGAP
jgi:prepilin-type processing-associated H-X9-DG protein